MSVVPNKSTTATVLLSTEEFHDAIRRYIDDNKPDPLCQKQLQGWVLHWTNVTNDCEEEEDVPNGNTFHHQINGTLNIQGDYMVIVLHVKCQWRSPNNKHSDDNNDTQKYGDLCFSCHVSGRFLTHAEQHQRTGQQNNPSTATSTVKGRPNNKIVSKMEAKLKGDAFISKLLLQPPSADCAKGGVNPKLASSSTSSSSSSSSSSILLAQAEIHFTAINLEERVTVSEDVCEAIQRAVWPMAESPLEVVDLLLNLPFLPTTLTPLANRAKLRLLEDALCDACEKEGDDDLLEELQISTTKKQKRG
jgi:hypothetical protein